MALPGGAVSSAKRWARIRSRHRPTGRPGDRSRRFYQVDIGDDPGKPHAPQKPKTGAKSPWRDPTHRRSAWQHGIVVNADLAAGDDPVLSEAARPRRPAPQHSLTVLRPAENPARIFGAKPLRWHYPSAWISFCASGSLSPAATLNCHSTRSRPVIISVTGCSTCKRIRRGNCSIGRAIGGDEPHRSRADAAVDRSCGGSYSRGRFAQASAVKPGPGPPRPLSGVGAAASSQPEHARHCRKSRRRPAFRCGADVFRYFSTSSAWSPKAFNASRRAAARL